MNASIHDYIKENTPEIVLTKPISHPTNVTSIIGHIGTDTARRCTVATFPRKKGEHWFRGDSSGGLTGYGVSEDVLDRLDQNGVDFVQIIVRDEGVVHEYDIAALKRGKLVAFAPTTNESVIADSEQDMRVDAEKFHDTQRVLPVEQALRTFDRDDVQITG